MLTIPQQKVMERWDELPYSLREAIFSEENSEILENISRTQNFDEEKLQILSTNVSDVLRGFMHSNNLIKELMDDLKIDKEIATVIVNEISLKIFEPVKIDLKSAYKPLMTGIATNTQSTLPEKQKELIKPQINLQNKQVIAAQAPIIRENTTSSQNQPFILHNEEEIEPVKDIPSQSMGERPIFYKPTFSEEYKKSVLEKEAASIELGEETKKKQQPESFKTPIKEVRVVHYSEFRTPLGPFENQNTKEVNQIIPKKELQNPQSETLGVHPNNVVDLKDLPIE